MLEKDEELEKLHEKVKNFSFSTRFLEAIRKEKEDLIKGLGITLQVGRRVDLL